MCEICNTPDSRPSDGYNEFEQAIIDKFNNSITDNEHLFTTGAEGLWEAYINNLHEGQQHYACTACRHFIERYGGLVTISDNGEMKSALWQTSGIPSFFVVSAQAMHRIVLKSKVTGVFFSKNQTLGQPVTGAWTHLSVSLPQSMVYTERVKSVGEITAEKKADFQILITGLKEYPLEAVEQAVTLLKTDSLYRSEKVLGVAEWLRDLHVKLNETKNSKLKSNLIWKAVATAPPGFVHIKPSMIGTLLDDIVAGMSYESVSRRFAEKMNPLQYQRPQAAPTAGNIERAEKLVEKLGIQKSLERRFARVEELQTIWKPVEEVETKVEGSGVFSHLKPKDKTEIQKMKLPVKTLTWVKFFETVLPTAKSIEYYINSRDYYSAILTAEHEDAPAILQWDNEETRNPFSWYLYSGGSLAAQWNLTAGTYTKVTAVCYQPTMWNRGYEHQGNGVLFIIYGAKDDMHKVCGNGLFPEILKSELREVRSTIEAYSKQAEIFGYNEASACGVILHKGGNWNAKVKVVSDIGEAEYILDRWD